MCAPEPTRTCPPDCPFCTVVGDCPFPGCGLPYSLEDERLMASSDPTGAALVRFYRCAAGHHWPDVAGAAVPD